MRSLRKDIGLYLSYLHMHLLSGLEYKGWWMMCIQVLVVCLSDPLPTLLMFSRMGSIGVWNWERILLVYSLALASYGMAESFCRGFDYFPWKMLQSGDFDRVMLRPRGIPFQVAGSVFHIHRLMRASLGLGISIWLLIRLNGSITPFIALVIGLSVIGGILLYSGVFILCAGIAFYTIKALDWIFILTNASYQVTRVPIDYMPRWLWSMFTFLMPVLLVSFYPASAACGWGQPLWTGFLALPAGISFLLISLVVWNKGVKHYQSTGS
ncbi:membrane protein [Clostridia bacterium]|nr:membrane protein [Clostridia bacterium]